MDFSRRTFLQTAGTIFGTSIGVNPFAALEALAAKAPLEMLAGLVVLKEKMDEGRAKTNGNFFDLFEVPAIPGNPNALHDQQVLHFLAHAPMNQMYQVIAAAYTKLFQLQLADAAYTDDIHTRLSSLLKEGEFTEALAPVSRYIASEVIREYSKMQDTHREISNQSGREVKEDSSLKGCPEHPTMSQLVEHLHNSEHAFENVNDLSISMSNVLGDRFGTEPSCAARKAKIDQLIDNAIARTSIATCTPESRARIRSYLQSHEFWDSASDKMFSEFRAGFLINFEHTLFSALRKSTKNMPELNNAILDRLHNGNHFWQDRFCATILKGVADSGILPSDYNDYLHQEIERHERRMGHHLPQSREQLENQAQDKKATDTKNETPSPYFCDDTKLALSAMTRGQFGAENSWFERLLQKQKHPNSNKTVG